MLSKMLLRKSASGPALDFRTSASATTTTITIPADAVIGDLAVLFDYSGRASSTPSTSVVPSGWTSISDISDASSGSISDRSIVCYKKLISGDPGSSVTGMTSYGYSQKHMLVFSPSSPIATITPAGLTAWANDGAIPEHTVPAQALNYVTLGAAGRFYESGAIAWVAAWDDATLTGPRGMLGYKLFNAAPANVAIDFTTGVATLNTLQTFALVVT